jgi:protease I
MPSRYDSAGVKEMKLDGKKVLMVVPHAQFRDEEFFEPKKLLEDEGAKVVVASTKARMCHGMKGGIVQADVALADAKPDDYDALVICGGTSVPEFLWNDKKLHELAVAMSGAGKIVAAICLATIVLAKAKLLTGREATVYFLPAAIEELKSAGAKYVKETLLIQNNLILAEGPPDSQRFGHAICAALTG